MSILRRLVTSFGELTPKERQSVVLVVGLSIESLIWIREMNAVDKKYHKIVSENEYLLQSAISKRAKMMFEAEGKK